MSTQNEHGIENVSDMRLRTYLLLEKEFANGPTLSSTGNGVTVEFDDASYTLTLTKDAPPSPATEGANAVASKYGFYQVAEPVSTPSPATADERAAGETSLSALQRFAVNIRNAATAEDAYGDVATDPEEKQRRYEGVHILKVIELAAFDAARTASRPPAGTGKAGE